MKEEKKSKKQLTEYGEILFGVKKSVGGHIPASKMSEWELYSKRCKEVGVSITCEGFLDMLETHNRINDIMFPLAKSYGYNPLKFKNEMLIVYLAELAKNTNDDALIKKAKELHDNILLTLKGDDIVYEKKLK